jgi:hypothetical protein
MSQEVWSIDPGERIGFARWWDDGTFIEKEVLDFQSFLAMLHHRTNDEIMDGDPQPSVIVCEQWAFRPGQTGRGDTMVSAQVIGALRSYFWPGELTFQDSGILRVTAMHCGLKVPKGHIPDEDSAYLHGFHYFERIGVLKARAIW